MSPHGALTEPSRTYRVVTHDRKGREGKGSGKEGQAGSHSSSGRSRCPRVADHLTVASCPPMNELRRGGGR